jgi:hypothetical protein
MFLILIFVCLQQIYLISTRTYLHLYAVKYLFFMISGAGRRYGSIYLVSSWTDLVQHYLD